MYPVLSRKETLAYLADRQSGLVGHQDLQPTYSGSADPDFVDDVQTVLEQVHSLWLEHDSSTTTSDQGRDALEGELSAVLHKGFNTLPAALLTDKEFWRFCSAFLYDFVVWRQPSKTATALRPYFGVASDSLGVECVPHRMFDRAHIAFAGTDEADEANSYELAKFGAADVWKSHIIRTRNSYAPKVVHELLVDVQAGKLRTDPVRKLAKNLKRIRSNVLFEVLDQHQARVLIDRESSRSSTASTDMLDPEDEAS